MATKERRLLWTMLIELRPPSIGPIETNLDPYTHVEEPSIGANRGVG